MVAHMSAHCHATIALVQDEWPGSFEWCVTANILSYYIVYGIIYSSTLVTLEVRDSKFYEGVQKCL